MFPVASSQLHPKAHLLSSTANSFPQDGRISALVLTSILALPATLCLCDPSLPTGARAGSCCRPLHAIRSKLTHDEKRNKFRRETGSRKGRRETKRFRRGPHTTTFSQGFAVLPLRKEGGERKKQRKRTEGRIERNRRGLQSFFRYPGDLHMLVAPSGNDKKKKKKPGAKPGSWDI
ncbi:hypothetical protein HDV57DRAFT_135980 [Trichoderma longibrachiatum]